MAKRGRRGGNDRNVVIVQTTEEVARGHHGGAWKVAYADFVTAMMAFFLLMWLLNATTEAQRRGLADYFSERNVLSRNVSGSGRPFGGRTPFEKGTELSDNGTMQVMPGPHTPTADVDAPQGETSQGETSQGETSQGETSQGETSQGETPQAETPGTGRAGAAYARPGRGRAAEPARAIPLAAIAAHAKQHPVRHPAAPRPAPPGQPAAAAAAAARAAREARSLDGAAAAIRAAVAADPALAAVARQLAVEVTPEGLRIRLLDADRQPMFALGSAVPNDVARALLAKVAPVLATLSEPIAITGHTDATPYHGTDRTNWELSSDRANATRRLLVAAGLDHARIRRVTGDADRDPLVKDDPFAAANRRMSIMVLRQSAAPVVSPPAAPALAPALAAARAPAPGAGGAPGAAPAGPAPIRAMPAPL